VHLPFLLGQGRVTFITTLRNSTALTKIEAQVSFLTLNLSYLFFFRRFFFNLGSVVPWFFLFLIQFVLRNHVISSFSLLHFMFRICSCMCFLSSSCCSHGHIPVVFFSIMSSIIGRFSTHALFFSCFLKVLIRCVFHVFFFVISILYHFFFPNGWVCILPFFIFF